LRTDPHPALRARERLVIVGNGMASYKLCEQLAVRGGSGHYEVLVLGDEPRPAYDRVHLTDFLNGRSDEDLILGSRDWYANNDITLRTGCRAIAIDRARRAVLTQSEEAIAYDRLVLAVGSRPFVPMMDGADLPRVFVYRTIEDLLAIRECARTSQTAAVIGGGLLGLEAARALQALGVCCDIVEYAPHVLCTQLDPRAGELAMRQIEAMRMRIHTNARLHRISADGGRRVLHFAGDQPVVSVDFVVIAAGIRPRHELAEACGLTIAVPGGILVNDRLETLDPNIYAIGECASHRGATYGLVAPAYRMAEVLAENLLGGNRRFEGADVSTRLKVLGLDVAVFGDYNQPAASYSWESDRSYRRIVVRGDKLIGASALGEWPEAAEMQDAVRKRRRVWPWQLRRFRRQGTLWRPRRSRVREWPADATVCNCMNVSCGTLNLARQNGCTTVQALSGATGASTLCGSCRPLLAELLGADVERVAVKGTKALAIAAIFAVLATAAFLLAPAIPYAMSVQSTPYDSLWRDGVWRQTTGFTLLGLSLLGLLMSARKRLTHFTRGDFGLWRALHGLLGAGGLTVLVAHTGLRAGSNLTFALMTFFVLANLAGAFAGGILSSDALGAGPWGNRLRRWFVFGHIAMVWPLPVLVGFHVFSSYYF
jgi:nitrite reductase (NADH) large subunit